MFLLQDSAVSLARQCCVSCKTVLCLLQDSAVSLAKQCCNIDLVSVIVLENSFREWEIVGSRRAASYNL